MRYRQAKKLLWSSKTPRIKSALAGVSAKQRERVAQAGSGPAAAHRRRKRVRANARWFKAWNRSPVARAVSEASERFAARFSARPIEREIIVGKNPITGEPLGVLCSKVPDAELPSVADLERLLAMLAATIAGDPDS